MKLRRPFGRLLRETRLNANKKIFEVAERIDVSSAYLSQIETGRRNPPHESVIRKVADFLGTDAAPLLRAAELDKEFVELGLVNVSDAKAELAFILQRGWSSITDREAGELKELLRKLFGDTDKEV